MPDFASSNYSQNDTLNTKPVPNGLPNGTNANSLYPVIRSVMGACKRAFDHINAMVTAGGTANALTLTYEVPPFSPHPKGAKFAFFANANNTGAATMNINGIGTYPITSSAGEALGAGAIVAGQIYAVTFDGVRFRLDSYSLPKNVGFDNVTLAQALSVAGNVTAGADLTVTGGVSASSLTVANVGAEIRLDTTASTIAGSTFFISAVPNIFAISRGTRGTGTVSGPTPLRLDANDNTGQLFGSNILTVANTPHETISTDGPTGGNNNDKWFRV